MSLDSNSTRKKWKNILKYFGRFFGRIKYNILLILCIKYNKYLITTLYHSFLAENDKIRSENYFDVDTIIMQFEFIYRAKSVTNF